MDATLEFMKKHSLPMNRQNYLEVLFMGGEVPEIIDGEIEAEIPIEFRLKNAPDDWEEID